MGSGVAVVGREGERGEGSRPGCVCVVFVVRVGVEVVGRKVVGGRQRGSRENE